MSNPVAVVRLVKDTKMVRYEGVILASAVLEDLVGEGTQLYTHTDPGEVERKLEDQRREFTHAQTVEHRKWSVLVDNLRTTITEREALLRELLEYAELGWDFTPDISVKVRAALSASAEEKE